MTMQAATIPNLRPDERGVATGNAAWPLARVRITSIQADPPIARVVNGPVAPRQVVAQISVSLVDAEGAVLSIGGRLVVQDATRHSWIMGGPKAFEPDKWLNDAIAADVARAVAMANDLALAEAAGLLAPVTVPVPGDELVPVPAKKAAAMAKIKLK